MFDWNHPSLRSEIVTLRNGRIPIPKPYGIEDIDYSKGIDWASFNTHPPFMRWWMNSFKYLRALLISPVDDDIRIASRMLEQWAEDNSENPKSNFAWDGHATAVRAVHIACLKTRTSAEWLDRSGEQHGEFLCDPANYQGNWNHGLDQNIGLVTLGYAFAKSEWIELAHARSIEAITAMIDWQGVSIEQSIKYHFYNYLRFKEVENTFQECGKPLPAKLFDKIHLMPEFVAHATAPDGEWVRLGDSTDYTRARTLLAGTEGEFALTQGRQGKRPATRFSIYHGGYIFGRSGWGEERPFYDESYYTIRFGPGRIIHGHNDHTSITYHARGQEILIDGGFHGYTKDKWRDHLRSPAAHNTVFASGKASFAWQARTKLDEFHIENGWQSYSLIDRPYEGTERHRSALFVQDAFEAIVVMDRLVGPKRNYQQAWHFNDAFALTAEAARVVAKSQTTSVSIHQLWPHDGIEIVRGRENPPQGWAGYGQGRLHPVPTILTSKKAGTAAYLTVIVIQGSDETPVQVTQNPVRRDGTAREIVMRANERKIAVSLMEDGMLRVLEKR